MLQRKALRFRLYPTPDQAIFFAQTAGVCRVVWNLALEQRETFGRRGRAITYVAQAGELKLLKAEYPWVAAAPHHCLQQALKDLETAFRNFFEGRARYPRYRRKGARDCFRFPDPKQFRIDVESDRMFLPKAKWVRARLHRPIEGIPKSITISREADAWYASVLCEVKRLDPAPVDGPAIGVDLNAEQGSEIALSDGRFLPLPRVTARQRERERRLQRALARKKKGSNNRRRAARRFARFKARQARRRLDGLHKATTMLAKSHELIVVEDLNVTGMTRSAAGTRPVPGRNVRQKAGLNRSMLEVSFGEIRRQLAYKAGWYGSRILAVPAHHTSQTCSLCGCVDAQNRVARAEFVCGVCGHYAHADTNAARNILRRGLSLPGEGPSLAACGALDASRALKQELLQRCREARSFRAERSHRGGLQALACRWELGGEVGVLREAFDAGLDWIAGYVVRLGLVERDGRVQRRSECRDREATRQGTDGVELGLYVGSLHDESRRRFPHVPDSFLLRLVEVDAGCERDLSVKMRRAVLGLGQLFHQGRSGHVCSPGVVRRGNRRRKPVGV